ncbi:MAG: hypothetical protein V4690_04330 [Patescibacteria group bacterium]
MKFFPYPSSIQPSFIGETGFCYDANYVKSLKEKFPDWENLHTFLDRNDRRIVNKLLESFLSTLESVSTKRIEMMSHRPEFGEFIDELVLADGITGWLKALRKQYFPELAAAYEEAERLDQE